MGQKNWLLLVVMAMPALARPPQSTIRVQVKGEARPVENADVTASGGHSSKTGSDGVAVLIAPLGHVDVNVTKEGFFPASASLDVDAAKEWQLEIELQPQKEQQQEITVYATRTDTRLQDSPLHVEVVSQDEINEEMAMRPGDISMLLNEMGGMRVQTTSPALGASSVRVQGMRGRYTAFLSDGLPLLDSRARPRAAADSANGFRPGRSDQGQRLGAVWQRGNGGSGQSHFAQASRTARA